MFVQLKTNKTAASAQAFLKALHKACPLKITKLLTDNGKEFTDRLFASREREPSGNHEFDQLCKELGIEHRLTRPRTPRTNGMVERFNGRIADVLKTHRFNSREDMEQTLLRYVALYNHQLPQSALKSKTPMQAMKEWYQTHPHLFHKRPYDRPGCDNYSISADRSRTGCVIHRSAREIFGHRPRRESALASPLSKDSADAPKPHPWQKSSDGCPAFAETESAKYPQH